MMRAIFWTFCIAKASSMLAMPSLLQQRAMAATSTWQHSSFLSARCLRLFLMGASQGSNLDTAAAMQCDTTGTSKVDNGELPMLKPLDKLAHRYLKQRGAPCPEIRLKAHEHWRTDDVTIRAYTDIQRKGLRRVLNVFNKRSTCIGKAGLRTTSAHTAVMDEAIYTLFGTDSNSSNGSDDNGILQSTAIPVAPIIYVYVDPRYRGYGFGTRLFRECMNYLANQGIEYALITVQDNGSGKLVPFYEAMGYISASHALGIEQFDSSTLMLAKLSNNDSSNSSNSSKQQNV
eukprot:7526-Heterococcus_DN1.PRE.2